MHSIYRHILNSVLLVSGEIRKAAHHYEEVKIFWSNCAV